MKKLAATISFLMLINRTQAQKLEWTNPEGLGKNPAFSQIVRAGKLLFIAGQTGVTADGKVLFVANYLSDTLQVIDVSRMPITPPAGSHRQ